MLNIQNLSKSARLKLAGLTTIASGLLTACMPGAAYSGPTALIGDSLSEGYRNVGFAGFVAPDRQPVTISAQRGRRADQVTQILRSDYGLRNAVNHAATVVIADGTNIASGDYAVHKSNQMQEIFKINPDARVLLVPNYATKNSSTMAHQNRVLHDTARNYSAFGRRVEVVPLNVPKGCLNSDGVHPRVWCYNDIGQQIANWINAPTAGIAPPSRDLVK